MTTEAAIAELMTKAFIQHFGVEPDEIDINRPEGDKHRDLLGRDRADSRSGEEI